MTDEATETTGTMKERELTPDECTISGIIKVIEEEMGADDDFWFRGQVRYGYDLVPGLFRPGVSYNEAGMLEDFKREYPEHENMYKQPIDWLSIMQHYGLPTRILDWSTNLLIGLFFTVNSLNPADTPDFKMDNMQDGGLFILRPSALSKNKAQINGLNPEQMFNSYAESESPFKSMALRIVNLFLIAKEVKYNVNHFELIYSKTNGKKDHQIHNNLVHFFLDGSFNVMEGLIRSKINELGDSFAGMDFKLIVSNGGDSHEFTVTPFSLPTKFTPPHLNERIRAQSGVFSMHDGYSFNGIEFVPFTPPEDSLGENLLKICIPRNHKAALLKELGYAGITIDKVFPEMERVAAAIKKRHSFPA